MKQINLLEKAPRMLCVVICLIFVFGSLAAQEVTVVNDQSDNSASSDQVQNSSSNYEVKSSFEFGIRGRKIVGNGNKYRSDLNYGPGFRLFDSSLFITAKESKGKPFDSLLITGSGWNADPNGYTRVSAEKLGWYKFDSTVRRMSYFNSLDNFAENEHTRNTKRNMGDFDVTILPQNENLKFHLGYSFNSNNGPAGTTFDYDRDEFPFVMNYRTRSDDLRIGLDAKILGFHLSFTEGYRRFNDDTSFSIDGPQLGTNPNPNSSIATFSRTIPERGKVFDHRLSVHRSFAKRADFTGRLIYSVSKSRFNMLDELTGRDRLGNIIVLDRTNVNGDAKRPNFIGDAGLTVFVTDKFRISNSFSANSYRISGTNILLQNVTRTTGSGGPLSPLLANTSGYRYTNYRRYMNTLEGDYDLNRYFAFYLGYRYTHRTVTLSHLDINLVNQTPTLEENETEVNRTNTVIVGFKLSPIPKKWIILFDIDHGQADNVFTRIANYNATNMKIRSTVKPTNKVSFNFSYQKKNNNNPSRSETVPPTDFKADVKSNIFAASFDWTPTGTVSVNGGYTHNRVTAETAVYFPSTPPGGYGQGISRYFLRNNLFNLDGWFQPHKRMSIFASYRIARDNSKGDFYDATTRLIESSYPLSFQSPEVRLIFRLTRNIDWNVGYQYYKYDELVRQSQNYSAHLPYTSLRIYFGKGIEDR